MQINHYIMFYIHTFWEKISTASLHVLCPMKMEKKLQTYNFVL